MTRARDPYEAHIDVAKGLAILAVIVGHLNLGWITSLMYGFHMPFFFLLAGFMHHPKQQQAYLQDRFRRVIVPYLSYLLLLAPIALFRGERWQDIVLGHEQLGSVLLVFWFPTCFFLTSIVWNDLRNRFDDHHLYLIAGASVLCSMINQFLLPDLWLPWALHVCFFALPLVCLGHALGKHIFRPSLPWAAVSALIFFIFAALTASTQAPKFDMKLATYGWPIASIIIAVAGSCVVASMATLLSRFELLSRPFIYLGKASLTVMFVHIPVLIMLLELEWIHHPFPLVVFMAAISCAVHVLLAQFSLSKALFLGERSSGGALRPQPTS